VCEISLEQRKLETLNFVNELIMWSLLITNCPQVGVVSVSWPISKFWGSGHIADSQSGRSLKPSTGTDFTVTVIVLPLLLPLLF